MRVAVMQPYFYPYVGYFRLISSVDLFVIFDCVQFPRRGRVHRAQVPDQSGKLHWLTLPLEKAPQSTLIKELKFKDSARSIFSEGLSRFTYLSGLPIEITNTLIGPFDRPIDYLERNLRATMDHLNIDTPITRSSHYGIPDGIRRGERVRAVAKKAGATHYVNLPGGRSLYESSAFISEGLQLEFLAPYEGSRYSMLEALATESAAVLAADARKWLLESA